VFTHFADPDYVVVVSTTPVSRTPSDTLPVASISVHGYPGIAYEDHGEVATASNGVTSTYAEHALVGWNQSGFGVLVISQASHSLADLQSVANSCSLQ
jgi:hypothetical protein